MTLVRSACATSLALAMSAGFPLHAWQWSTPLPHGDSVYAVTHCGGTYVAVGGAGRAWVSSDALTWTEGTTGVAERLLGVACDGTRYVAVGDRGRILESSDGSSWSVVSSPSTAHLMNVAYLGSAFVAAGEDGTLMTSPDGLSWTLRASSPGAMTYFLGLAAMGSTWLAAGGDWTTDNNGLVSTSSDGGETWTTPEVVTTASEYGWFNGATAGSGGFALAHDDGSVVTSANGQAPWTEHATGGGACWGIDWDGAQYLATCGSTIYSSPDASAWSPNASGTQRGLLGLSTAGPTVVSVGDGRTIVAYDDDAGAWALRETSVGPAGLQLYSAAWGGGRYVVVSPSSGFVWSSPDAVHWASSPRPASGFGRGVTNNGSIFAAVGSAGAWTSPDGVTWTSLPLTEPAYLVDVAWDGAAWVAISSNGVRRGLPELAPESLPASPTVTLRSVACGEATCIAVGYQGAFLARETSPQCPTVWCLETAPLGYEAENFYAVSFHAGRFVAVGSAGAILTREVGSSTWTPRTSGVPEWLYGVGWVGSRFVAGGSRGVLVSSSDGQVWAPEVSGTGRSISGVCEGQPLLVGGDMILSDSLILHSEFETGDFDGWSTQ